MLKFFAGGLAALLLIAPAFANAAPPPPAGGLTPDVFIQTIYSAKMDAEKASAEFGAAQTDALVLADFSAELLALYKQAIDIDEPIVDGDVFWDSQEYRVTKIDVKTVKVDPTSAVVEASFDVMPGQPRKVTYQLKRHGSGWQIDDIAGSGGSMRTWLAEGIKAAGK